MTQVTDADPEAEAIADIINEMVSSPPFREPELREAHRLDQLAAANAILARHRNQSTAALMGEVERLREERADAIELLERAYGDLDVSENCIFPNGNARELLHDMAGFFAALSTPSEVREPNPDEVAGVYSAFEVREPEAISESMSKCNRCGKLWPSAPLGVIHKCECSGGICHPVTEAIGGGEAERNAFKAGWRTNAVADNAENAEYHKNCEAGDYAEYQRLGLTAYLDSIVPEAPATPQPVSGDAVREALDWFSGQRRLSLQHYSPMYGDDDDQSVEWRVHRESGSINDREWEIVGRGETALAAILAALNHGGTQS